MKTCNSPVKFHKYSALGNHFCVIDETDGIIFDEQERFLFAQEYSSFEFGIGCDSILFIQPPDSRTFSQLCGRFADLWLNKHTYRLAWRMIVNNMEKAHAIMRIFEPFGHESAMCGNGIRCVADHLCRKWDLRKLRIIAEMTTPQPRIYEVEQCHRPHYYRIRMEGPKSLPLQFRGDRYSDLARAVGEYADVLDLTLPEAVADQMGSEMLRCYVTYTGEPHLVCFVASNRDVQNLLALPPNQLVDFFLYSEKLQTNLINTLGDYLNDRLETGSFCGIINPGEGINVCIAEVKPHSTVNMRVYERGIWRKTKSCGTGAMAIAALAWLLNLIGTNSITVLSEGSFYHTNGSLHVPGYVRCCGVIIIETRAGSWFLQGPVERIYTGRIDHWQKTLLNQGKKILAYSCTTHASDGQWLYDPQNRRRHAA